MNKTKIQSVYNLMKRRRNKGLTQLDLYILLGQDKLKWKQFTTRLGAVVFELRKVHGCVIDTAWEHNDNTGTRWKRYFLVSGNMGE